MSAWQQHLVVVPVVLPLVAGAAMLLIDERRYALKGLVSAAATLLLVAAAIALARLVDQPTPVVYRLGGWEAPYGIVLVADRLSAALVLLNSVLGLAATVFSLARWAKAGPRFHALAQFMLMGVNGAFLTGDLFNLFVFFEVLLAASYGLALHGSGAPRVRASMHYIVINLAASLLFLIGASLMYGLAGTLNFADLAARAATAGAGERALLEAGASILGIAFLLKAGAWPLGFWLTGAYSAACAPAAALFTVLSKVGVYAVLRTWLLVFGAGAGATPFGGDWLVAVGLVTLTFGFIGVLAAQEMPRMAAYSLVVSSGTLLAAIGMDQAHATAAALYYLIASTLGVSAFFLLIELVERGRRPGAALLAVTAEAFDDAGPETEIPDDAGIAIPATMALLGMAFAACALAIAGLPPLPGFVAKFALLGALLDAEVIGARTWAFLALVVLSGLAAIVAIGRAGANVFWAEEAASVPRVRVIEMGPVVLLLALSGALTVYAGPAMDYLTRAAQALHAPASYIGVVLRRP